MGDLQQGSSICEMCRAFDLVTVLGSINIK